MAPLFIDALTKPDAFTKRPGTFNDLDCRATQAFSFLRAGHFPELSPVHTRIIRRGDSRADHEARQKLIQDLSDEAGFKLDKLTDKWHKLPKWEVVVYHWEWTRLNRSNPPPTP